MKGRQFLSRISKVVLLLLTCVFPVSVRAMTCPGASQGTYQGVYGVWSTSDYAYLADHGINWMIVEIWDYDPVEGLEVLNAAADQNMKVAFVIIQRGEFGDSSFTLAEAEKRFTRFFLYKIPSANKYAPGRELKYHPALAANYPYSMNHQVLDDWANGTSKINVLVTEHRKKIYEYNKQVTMKDDGTWIPLLVHYRSVIQMGKYDNWHGDGITRGFAAGEADIALIHDYPNYTHEGDSDPSTTINQELEAFYKRERDYILARDPNIKINMLLGATVSGRMPTSADMETWACIIAQAGGADAISWWPWRHGQYATQLGSQSGGSYMYQDQHCSLYSIAATFIPGWLTTNAPNSPSHCPTIPISSVTPTQSVTSTPTTGATQTGTPTAIPTGTGKTGDANGDGKVDGIDYTIWLNNYLATSTQGPAVGDFNRDGKVDGVDYTLWLTNYLT